MENTTFTNSSNGSQSTLPTAPSEGYDYFVNVFILKIITMVIFVIGTIGNSLAICILSKKKNRSSSTANYLLVLAMSDNFILLMGAFTNWISSVCNINFRNLTGLGCIFHIFLSYVPVSVSSWLLALVTIERVISVVWPYNVKEWCTIRKTRIVIGSTICFICVYYLHFFFGFESKYNPNLDIACRAESEDYLHFLSFILPYLDFSLTFLLPCAIIIPGNIVIVHQLARNRARRKALTSTPGPRDSSVTRTLVIAGLVFVVTVSPISVLFITYEYWLKTVENKWFILVFWRVMFNVIADINAAVNFYLYVLSGTKFRQEVKDLFRFRCSGTDRIESVFEEGNHDRTNRDGQQSVYVVSTS